MDKVHQTALTRCQPKIVSDLSFESEFLDNLKKQRIFTDIMLEEIEAKPSRAQKVRKLLDDLKRRGETAYAKFLDCLDKSGHEHLAKNIRDIENEIRNSNAQPHHPADSSNHGDDNLLNQIDNSPSLPNMSASDSMVTSTSDESASNSGNTTDDVILEYDSISNMSSQGSATSLQDTEKKSTNSMSEKAEV